MYGSKFWTVAPLVAVIACAGDRVIAPGPTQVAPGPLSASQTASSLTALRRDESFLASFLERLERRSEVGTSSNPPASARGLSGRSSFSPGDARADRGA